MYLLALMQVSGRPIAGVIRVAAVIKMRGRPTALITTSTAFAPSPKPNNRAIAVAKLVVSSVVVLPSTYHVSLQSMALRPMDPT